MKKKYYVVWQGKEPGIYTSWDACEKQVKGVEGAKYKSFPTREAAEEAFAGPAPVYRTKSLSSELECGVASWKSFPKEKQPIMPCLCVDAACSGNPGKMEYRGVWVGAADVSAEWFHRGVFEDGTNNIGEFLAIVHGLAQLKKDNSPLPIYSDSKTAQAWVRNKHAKTKLESTAKNAVLFELIRRAENWLQNNTYTTRILKWDTEHWGEIPADFGRK